MERVWLAQSEADVPASPLWLTPDERERASTLRFAKRRNDYLLARWTAKRAVAAALDLTADLPALQRIEVRNRESGAPELRLDGELLAAAVSLSDRAGWGVCALGPADAALGCDLELIEPRSPGFVADYLTARERQEVAAASDDTDRARRANLIWCAKESALKLLGCGLRRDTRDVEVCLAAGAAAGRWRALAVRSSDGREFPGWWAMFGSFLLTTVASRRAPPPRSLVEPSPLEHARPTHTWLTAPCV